MGAEFVINEPRYITKTVEEDPGTSGYTLVRASIW